MKHILFKVLYCPECEKETEFEIVRVFDLSQSVIHGSCGCIYDMDKGRPLKIDGRRAYLDGNRLVTEKKLVTSTPSASDSFAA